MHNLGLADLNAPLVSCIMPTHNRRSFVPQAIEYFLRQDYPNRELLIVDDGTDPIKDLVPHDPRIYYLCQDHKHSVGTKRNLACQAAKGEIIIHWDDDDWIAPWRLRYQVSSLLREEGDICGLAKVLFYNPHSECAWQYTYPRGSSPWVYGGTLCYTKVFWKQHPFPDLNIGEDSLFVWSKPSARVVALQERTFYVALIHSGNTSPKQVTDNPWHSYPARDVQDLLGEDLPFYASLFQEKHQGVSVQTLMNEKRETRVLSCGHTAKTVPPQATTHPMALVVAASGIGDILRITPLIRVLSQLGYSVDVLLQPDYPDVVTLLEGAPEIRHLFSLPRELSRTRQPDLDGLSETIYDIATFTMWGSPLQRLVRARQTFAFEPTKWLQEGDSACVTQVARTLGWEGALPAPFAIPSNRRFDLPTNTIALHPGCKPDWPWKRWHGFDELARLLPNVVILGTDSDVQNAQTYFRRTFEWPSHAKNFVGRLSLQDTAALLRECAALVSNDSGLMHLGVAMGIPTLGIFGITSPQREVIPSDHMFPITKGLPCEPACRQRPWGRRDCEYHLQCLKSLTAHEVLDKIRASVTPKLPKTVTDLSESKTMDDLSIVYYGYIFDASGYGHAARAYIHALHHAGISLSVVNLGNQTRQVRDELVESLLNRRIVANFHLFHGIPSQWARLAFPLPNAIGMTVWETDSMPTQWRTVLNHVLDVWLPSEFNVSVFGRDLETLPFQLPHPIFLPQAAGQVVDVESFLGVAEHDVVFYSISRSKSSKSVIG